MDPLTWTQNHFLCCQSATSLGREIMQETDMPFSANLSKIYTKLNIGKILPIALERLRAQVLYASKHTRSLNDG